MFPFWQVAYQITRSRADTKAMDTEMALGMSLDDIINNQKKQKPLGSNKSKAKSGPVPKQQSPKVFPGPKGFQRNGQAGKNRQQQHSNQGRKTGQQRAPLVQVARRPTQNGGIAKPARKGPQTQTNKGNQRAATNMIPGIQAPKRTGSMNEPLKITISNDRSQRPVLPRPQARSVIPNPQQQFIAPGQGQAGRVRSTVQAANGYMPAVMQTEYAVAAQPVRQTFQDNAGRNLNNAASYLRDPYRGDDFERGSIGGMRSDAAYGRTQRVRAYDSLLDDSLREDDRGRTNSYNNSKQGRQSGRNSRDKYRQ